MMQRLLLFCGVVSPLLYALADFLAGRQWEGYSFRDQTISELGAVGAPSSSFFSAILIGVYLIFLAFGVGVWRSARGRPRLRVAGALLTAFALLALTLGQFAAMRMRGDDQGMAGALHLIEGAAAMVLLFGAMGFTAAALGRRFALYTVLTLAVMLGFGGWSAMDIPLVEAGLPTPWVGVKERIYWYSYQLWFAVLAVKLLTERPAEDTTPAR